MAKDIKKLLLIFLFSLLLNWLWENLHAPLYFHPDGQVMTQTMLFGAAVGDAVYITILGIAFLKIPYLRNRLWLSLFFGIVVAVGIEVYALQTGLWAYHDSMPILPLLNTGLTPTLQLGLLSYLVYKLVRIY